VTPNLTSDEMRSVLSPEDYERFLLLQTIEGTFKCTEEELASLLLDLRNCSDAGDAHGVNRVADRMSAAGLENVFILMAMQYPEDVYRLGNWHLLTDGRWNRLYELFERSTRDIPKFATDREKALAVVGDAEAGEQR